MRSFPSIIILTVIILTGSILAAGCSPSPEDPARGEGPGPEKELPGGASQTEEASLEDVPGTGAVSAEAVNIDGEIGEAEYMSSFEDKTTGMEVFWSNDSRYLYMGITTGSAGWVSVGFDPQTAMKGADMVFLAHDGSQIIARDDFGTSTFGHDSDIDLGGSLDIREYAGMKNINGAVYEFIIPLDSGDEFDKKLSPGNSYEVILAVHHSSIDFDIKHSARSSGEITLY